MPRFEFRLSPLLSLRETVRDEKRELLADALRVAEGIDAQLAEIAELMAHIKRRQAAGVGRVDVDRLLDASRYETVLMVERMRLEQQRAAVAEEIERRRQALAAADVEVRVLEKLRDKQAERFRLEQERQDAKRLDEVASLRHAAAEEG